MRTLMYHDIAVREARDEVGFPGPLAGRYKLEPTAFDAHLRVLAAQHPLVGTLDGESPGAGLEPTLVITFDDGGRSASVAAEALERHGWRGQFFVTTSRIGTPGFLSRDGVRDLARRGHTIGSHSHTHPTYMGLLSRSELEHEWTTSRAVLEDVLGRAPRSASVPGGYLSREVIATAAAAGYEVLFTSEPTARVQRGVITVRGRYTIWDSTPAKVAAAYARGDRRACSRLWIEWNAKKLAKRVSPQAYQALRGVRAHNS